MHRPNRTSENGRRSRLGAPLWVAGLFAGLAGGWLLADAPAPRAGSGSEAFSGEPPLGYTGSPGEGTCAQCHTGVGGNGSVEIQGVPAEYVPAQTYALSVTLQDPGQLRWGFELTALRFDSGTSSHVRAGTLTRTSVYTAVRDGFNGRQYVSHSINNDGGPVNNGTFPNTLGPTTWNFSWTAPPAGQGTVTFYAAGNAANNDGGHDGGDFVYTDDAPSTEGSATDVAEKTWGEIKTLFR